MASRKRMSRRASNKKFRGAVAVHPKNVPKLIRRGGMRL